MKLIFIILVSRKREDYIDWDEYFLAVSILSSQRSKDPGTQVRFLELGLKSKFLNHFTERLLRWVLA
jgi:hypothetical protein